MIREAGWRQEPLAERVGVGPATLKRILAGTSDPGDDRLAAICATIDRPITLLLLNDDHFEAGSNVQVDVYDVEVAAGHGREALGEEPVSSWPFPRDWIARHFDPNPDLALVRVVGDSQDPELRDGDLVMIDVSRPRVRDGLHVVRLDSALLIKRIQVEGSTVRLKSANPAYDDIVIELEPDQQRFAVIGRAGTAIKTL